MGPLDVQSDRVDPLVGSMLGKDYRVIEPIGFGGMAVVYLVEHQTLLKRFAAKVLSVELAANLEARARFTQEAHSASQLDHENIVNISDFGVTGDQRPFFVMELLRGQTLDQRIAGAAMSIEEVVAVGVPVARALAHAHAEGIVHRDVKPENVFLVQRSQGRFGVKVVDFGIAKTPANSRFTKMGEALGSPRFMSPEACRGDDVDHRADLYSFGVLLYLMLCGRVPFEDENLLKVLQMQVSAPLPSPRSINPEVSLELAAVLERALAKDPDARYVSMDALLIDLEAAVPPGSDRLLIEAQTGGASSFRITAFTGQPSAQRLLDSQQLARVASQLLPGQPGTPPSTTASTDTLVTIASRRGWMGWIIALPIIGIAAFGGWFATHRDSFQPTAHVSPAADARVVIAPREPSMPREPSTPREPGTGLAHALPVASTAAAGVPSAHVAALAATIHLHLTSTPGSATVQLDGKRIGATPLDVELARRDGEAQLVISRGGFADVKQRLDLRADRSISIVLPPIARPPRVVKRPAPPAVDRREPARAGSAAAKGDPNLDIRLSR
jgi:serine/threonine protein kinase